MKKILFALSVLFLVGCSESSEVNELKAELRSANIYVTRLQEEIMRLRQELGPPKLNLSERRCLNGYMHTKFSSDKYWIQDNNINNNPIKCVVAK